MAEYRADEFLGLEEAFVPFTLANEVDKKVSLLYDLHILLQNSRGEIDTREAATRQMLLDCKSLISVDNAVHGVIVGKYTLNDILKRKGYLQ